MLSLLVPGMRQIYARSWRLGVALVVIGLGLTVCVRTLQTYPLNSTVSAAYLLLSVVIFAFMAGAGINAVRRIRSNPVPSRPRWRYSTWLAAIVYVLVMITLHFGLPAQKLDHWRNFSIPSASNIPALLAGDVVMAEAIPAGTLPARGDIVVFKSPGDPSTYWIKRVVGLPGDRIFLRNAQLLSMINRCLARPGRPLLSMTTGLIWLPGSISRHCQVGAAIRSSSKGMTAGPTTRRNTTFPQDISSRLATTATITRIAGFRT